MCHVNNEKWKKTKKRKDRTTKLGKIGTLKEKEIYMYLRKLETDRIKQVEIKEKNPKSISVEQKSFLK